jgi:hypothetical protein
MGPARLPGAGSERIPTALMADYQPRYPLARESTVKHDLVVIKIIRESVMDCDPSHMLKLLKNFTTTRPQIVAYEGRITFIFDGWDNDPRETAEIPEIRAYFSALTEKFPHWMHYVEKAGDTFMHVMRLLCTGHYEQKLPGVVSWSFDDLNEMKQVVEFLSLNMDRWHRRNNITYQDNQRIHQEIAQLIEATLN